VKLSVVMSVLNGAGDLARTLDSIFAQTERDFELIVIDDGSTDDTPSILARQSDPRIRVITQPNEGLTRALIRGCEAARAPLIARHDCGDVSPIVLRSSWGRSMIPASCSCRAGRDGSRPRVS
jgi:glycosyltransferase involved in cell wall biosynthesis